MIIRELKKMGKVIASDKSISPAENQLRYPFTSTPYGWYVIARSKDVAKNKIKTVHYFGEDIVIFRGVSGKIGVLKAHCPHLGAHLGVKGIVSGNHLRCPFHGWEFDVKGACKHIPYAEVGRIPKKANANSWMAVEANGFIMVYYSSNEVDGKYVPMINPAEISDPSWSKFYINRPLKIRTHVQELAENAFDLGHFKGLHGMGYPEVKVDSIEKRKRIKFSHNLDFKQYGYNFKFSNSLEQIGANNVINRVNWGENEFIVVLSNTPVNGQLN